MSIIHEAVCDGCGCREPAVGLPMHDWNVNNPVPRIISTAYTYPTRWIEVKDGSHEAKYYHSAECAAAKLLGRKVAFDPIGSGGTQVQIPGGQGQD